MLSLWSCASCLVSDCKCLACLTYSCCGCCTSYAPSPLQQTFSPGRPCSSSCNVHVIDSGNRDRFGSVDSLTRRIPRPVCLLTLSCPPWPKFLLRWRRAFFLLFAPDEPVECEGSPHSSPPLPSTLPSVPCQRCYRHVAGHCPAEFEDTG
jgi:hypothetical protein